MGMALGVDLSLKTLVVHTVRNTVEVVAHSFGKNKTVRTQAAPVDTAWRESLAPHGSKSMGRRSRHLTAVK